MFYKFISFNNISSLWKYNNFNKVIESFIKSFHAKDIYLIKRYINLSEFNYLVNLKKKKLVNKVERTTIFHYLQFKLLGVLFENLLLSHYIRFLKVGINSAINNSSLDFFFSLTKYNQYLTNLLLKSRNRKLYFWIYLFFSIQNTELFTR